MCHQLTRVSSKVYFFRQEIVEKNVQCSMFNQEQKRYKYYTIYRWVRVHLQYLNKSPFFVGTMRTTVTTLQSKIWCFEHSVTCKLMPTIRETWKQKRSVVFESFPSYLLHAMLSCGESLKLCARFLFAYPVLASYKY